MKTVEELKAEILSLNEESIREIIECCIVEHKRKLFVRCREKAFVLKAARKVRFIGGPSARLPAGAEGALLRISSKAIASVDFWEHGRWRLPCAFLEAVADEPAQRTSDSAEIPKECGS